MDNSEALAQLASAKVTDRRLAARFLARNAVTQDLEPIRRHLRGESDVWVRDTLQAALSRLGRHRPPEQPQLPLSLPEPSIQDEVWAQALADTTDKFLHELSPIVSELERRAESEVPEYSASRTRAAIARLQRYIEGMRRLRTVAGFPDIVELDLTDLIFGLVEIRRDYRKGVEIIVTRDEPLLVQGDQTFLEFAIDNGLKNALDVSPAEGSVIINHGITDKEAWVTILDEGVGLPPGSDKVWETGRTTKSKVDHAGMGLPIARQAMQSMGGSADIRARRDAGVEFELKWPSGSAAT